MAKTISSKNGSGLIRVLLAASSAIRRAGLEAAVKAAPRLKLVGSAPAIGVISDPAGSARVTSAHAVLSPALLAQVRALDPDVLLLDLDHADHHLFDLFAKLSFPDATGPAIVVLVDAASPAFTAHALRSGVKSILPRDAPADEIVSAIHATHAGFVLLDSDLAQDLARHIHADATRVHAEANDEAVVDANADEAFDDLTARETEILRMLAEGLGNKQIAIALGISEHTVKFHISSILDKLGASTRTEAVTSGIRMGLIFV